jgi:hypothetical protein
MRIDHDKAKGTAVVSFDSTAELANEAAKQSDAYDYMLDMGERFTDVPFGSKGRKVVAEYVRTGWSEQLAATMDVADAAVTYAERDRPLTAFIPTFDVSGSDVDVARYLSGEPECMIEYPLTEVVKAGRVITIVNGTGVSAAVSTENIIKRGRAIFALCIALERCGYATEVIADWAVRNDRNQTGSPVLSVRTLVKSAHDTLDAERLMYAMAHPSFTRVLTFSAANAAPKAVAKSVGVMGAGGWYGYSADPDPASYPEGSIILPSTLSGEDVECEAFVTKHLRELGILAE